MYKSYLSMSYEFHLLKNSSEILRNIINEVNVVTFYGLISGLLLITEILVTFAICTFLIIFEPIVSLVVLSTLIIITLLYALLVQKKIEELGKKRQHYDAQLIKTVQQTYMA